MADRKGISKGSRQFFNHLGEACRENWQIAYGTLLSIMTDPNEKAMARAASAKSLLEFGFGKAPMAVHITNDQGEEKPLNTYSKSELINLMMEQKSSRETLMGVLADIQGKLQEESKILDAEIVVEESQEKVVSDVEITEKPID